MKRCSDCAKWRERRGYCPYYAKIKGASERMCAYMAKEQKREYMREYMRARSHGGRGDA